MRQRFSVHALAAALLAVAVVSFASFAGADEKVVNIVFTGKSDPQTVEPGGSGTLVLTGAIRDTAHVYSSPAQFKVKTVAAPGVTYGAMKTSPTSDYKDPEFPDAPVEKVWMKEVVLRIPFTVATDAKAPVKVGVDLAWSACDEAQCYGEEKQSVVVEVHRGSDAAGPAPATNGSPPNVPAAPAPAPGAPGAPAAPAVGALKNSVALEPSDTATGTVTFHGDRVEVTIAPKDGFHVYSIGSSGGLGQPIEVGGKPTAGIAWKDAQFQRIEGEVTDPYVVTLPYTRSDPNAALRVAVKWQACNEQNCRKAEHFTAVYDAQGARIDASAPVPTPTLSKSKDKGLLFPSMKGGVLTPKGTVVSSFEPTARAKEENWIEALWKKIGILFLGPIFLAGLLLAFTPCVLPIIPITVSIIGGGRTDLSKGRLTFLLTFYALGLSISYGVLGLLAGTGGASFTAAFQHPVALYVIAGIFFLLSLGMFGIYELQPPAFMQRLQGGAKGGSPLGAFAFGALAAVIASPCVGPAIVAMLVFVAQSGNNLLGFLMFFTLGLGMSSVFFAAGSFNLLMRPGPWMVWVRWGFGVIMIAAAFYYLASAEKLVPPLLYVLGAIVAAAVAFGTWHHLAKKEMDEKAIGKSLALACVLFASVLGVGLITRSSGKWWTDIRDREHFTASVERAQKEGKVTVVDVWAPWCFYCRRYDDVIEASPLLHRGFERMNRLRINVDGDDRLDLRDGLGLPANTQPFMVFIDANGIQRDQDVPQWYRGEAAAKLEERLRALGVLKPDDVAEPK